MRLSSFLRSVWAGGGQEVDRGVSWEGEDAIIRLLDYIIGGRCIISKMYADAKASGELCMTPRSACHLFYVFFREENTHVTVFLHFYR